MNNENEKRQIQPDDTLTIKGGNLVAIVEMLQKLPYEVAAPIIRHISTARLIEGKDKAVEEKAEVPKVPKAEVPRAEVPEVPDVPRAEVPGMDL